MLNREEITSSSSDDEEVKRLQEAVINLENAPKPYSNGNSHSVFDNIHLSKKLSKRKNTGTDRTESNELNTTPEFRCFVAKKLGSYLDSVTECTEKKNIENDDQIQKNDGFRLFSASNGDWLTEIEVEKRSCVKRKKKRKSSSSESNEDERLKEAVVPDDFLKDIAKSVSENKSSEIEEKSIDKLSESLNENTNQCVTKKQKKRKHKNKYSEDCSLSEDEQQDIIEKKKHKKKKKKRKGFDE